MKLARREFLLLTASAATLPAVSAIARAQTVPPSNTGARLITLGTRSGPIPTVRRAQSSNLLIVNGALYVVDAGDGITRRLVRAKITMRDIGTIFITHPHSDHTSGLAALLQAQYDAFRTMPVNIYGPPGTEAIIKALVQYLDVDGEVRMSDGTRTIMPSKVFSGHDKGDGLVFQDGNIKVTAVENTHFHFTPGSPGYGKYKSYAYRFDTADRSIVFTGDTGPSDAVAKLAKGADLLVSEVNSVEEWKQQQIKNGRWQAMTATAREGSLRHMVEEHLSPDQVGARAASAGVKAVVLTHLPNTNDPQDGYARFADEVKRRFSGQVFVAKDLMEF